MNNTPMEEMTMRYSNRTTHPAIVTILVKTSGSLGFFKSQGDNPPLEINREAVTHNTCHDFVIEPDHWLDGTDFQVISVRNLPCECAVQSPLDVHVLAVNQAIEVRRIIEPVEVKRVVDPVEVGGVTNPVSVHVEKIFDR